MWKDHHFVQEQIHFLFGPFLYFSECDTQTVDIMFLVDSSASVGDPNFEKMKQFVALYAEYLDIGENTVHMGLVTWSTDVHVQFEMNKFHDSHSMIQAILHVLYTSGGTYTDKALNHIAFSSFTRQNGDRPNVKNVLVILTDGLSYDAQATLEAASFTHLLQIETFVVGIGDDIKRSELEAMATDEDHLFTLNSFDALPQLQLDLPLC